MIELPIVIDTSLTMAWCYDDEKTERSEALRERVGRSGAVVPAQWPIEVQNSLRVGERRGRVSPAEVQTFIAVIRAAPVEVDVRSLSTFGDLLLLARQHSVSPYDAAYIELALRRGLALATRDANMARGARALGVMLLDAR